MGATNRMPMMLRNEIQPFTRNLYLQNCSNAIQKLYGIDTG
jgi:hypothetical protein